MAIWGREDETEWEKYQRTKGRQGRPAPPPQAEAKEEPPEKEPLLGKLLGRLRPERAEAPEDPPERCPWCGGEMERGYLDAVRGGGIWWVRKRPGFKDSLIGADPNTSLRVDDEGAVFTCKTTWYCPRCLKMTIDAAGLLPPNAVQDITPAGDGKEQKPD